MCSDTAHNCPCAAPALAHPRPAALEYEFVLALSVALKGGRLCALGGGWCLPARMCTTRCVHMSRVSDMFLEQPIGAVVRYTCTVVD